MNYYVLQLPASASVNVFLGVQTAIYNYIMLQCYYNEEPTILTFTVNSFCSQKISVINQ